ncbi:diguanylate cyclase domain-containing protein [Bradyrhizobium sp. SZCCHNR2026]|uniref:diguanylate cyclase domain-containing protein n=1 Tax=Bradyrhizobium sp. SZCCHNR2026 TaxID=3057381 RepID=UPI0029163A75|nr:diguanylate cyclase [Bradyrhizobium sp. SZCCHNR2026]
MVPTMGPGLLSRFLHPNPAIRRELVDLLYTSLPQVTAINAASITGSVALAAAHRDPGYIAITCAIVINAIGRMVSLLRYKRRAARLSDKDVIHWERIYAAGAASFGLALGALSFRAFQLDDQPGAWLAFGLSMSYCVGMVSRAAIRPWVVLSTTAVLLAPTLIAGLIRPEISYRLGAGMLVLFWFTIREASRHLSKAFIERLEAKHALARQANHDFLTGLPNRAAFLNALETIAGSVSIVAIDLDGFKPVNDRHGHHAGDDLLRQVATRLSDCIGSSGMAARFGGDEFMLLKPVAEGANGREEALALTRDAIRALSMPFLLSDIPVVIGASAGLLVSDEPLSESEVADILQRVDAALYAAKRAGGGNWAWAEQHEAELRQTA